MVRLVLLLPLLLLSTGYILDRTDDHMGACLHEIPVLSREETRSPIRIRYERVDLDLSPDADEYLINTVVAGATR